MDLTTLTVIFLLVVSGLGVDESLASGFLRDAVERISATPSVLGNPAAQLGRRDAAGVDRRRVKASASFANHGAIAAWYFRLAWRDNQPVTRFMAASPATVSLH